MTAHDTIFAVTLSLILAMSSTADAQRVPPSGIVDDKIEPAVKRHVAKTLTFRHQIHQNPELGNREYETAKLVESHLRAVPSTNSSCVRLASCLQPGCLGRLHVGRFEDRRRLYSGV